jgi:hypothetical protein
VNRIIVPPKHVGETRVIPMEGFDFTADVSGNETIVSATVVAAVWSGRDRTPSAILSGPPSVGPGPIVYQRITGGVVGTIYYLLCTAVSSVQESFQLACFLAITPDSPA